MIYSIYSDGDIPLLEIQDIGYSGDAKVTRFGPAQRNAYIIHYVISGKGYYNGNPVEKGQGFLIFPNQPEQYFPDKSNPWEFLWIVSCDPAIEKLLKYYPIDENTKIFNYDFVPVIRNTAELLVIKKGAVMHTSEILEIFLHIFNYQINSTLSPKSNPDLFFDSCVKYIENNAFSQVTVNELTLLTGVSQPYLFKIFKQRTGLSPKQYIDNFRLIQAEKLLVETQMTVTQISETLGFPEPNAFTKFFCAKMNKPPLEYRRAAFAVQSNT